MSEAMEPYCSPPKLPPEEPPEDNRPHVKIHCTVFYDGTGNNRTNTESREAENTVYQANKVKAEDNSYENDITNIAKMEKYIADASGFDHTLNVYVEGPGTVNDKADTTRGYAFGTGGAGVKQKVEKGIDDLVAKIARTIPSESFIDKLVINVFGFSRGAAGARFFVHEVLNDEPTYVMVGNTFVTVPARPIFQRLLNAWYEITADKVEISFVGLYDTVASYGVPFWDAGTRLLKLDSLSRAAVKKVIHLVAADEHRANFPLTNIDSAGSKGTQIYLPGVHSDIGGSYRESRSEGDLEDKEPLTINRAYSEDYLQADRQQLIDEGWYKDGEIFIENASFAARYLGGVVTHALPSRPAQHKLNVYRQDISHDYDKIALHIMADFARKEGVGLEENLEQDECIYDDLTDIYDLLKSHANGGNSKLGDWFHQTGPAWLKDLRNSHLHFSAHYSLAGYTIAPNKPNFEDDIRERGTHEG